MILTALLEGNWQEEYRACYIGQVHTKIDAHFFKNKMLFLNFIIRIPMSEALYFAKEKELN